MKTKIFAAFLLVILIVAAIGGIKTLQIRKMIAGGAEQAPPPETVSTFEVAEQQWENSLTAIGSIRAAQGVQISSEIAGVVQEIRFDSGAHVEKNAVLIQLDASTEAAQLRAVEAQLELAKINLARAEQLRADNTVSASELDTARATVQQTQANADAIRANIEKKTIRAPFAGILGLRLVDLGQYIETGKTIVSLQSLSPAFADFSLPQQELSRLKTGMKVHLAIDAYPGRTFEGTLTAVNPDLDRETRSVPLRATFENPDKLLRPGMYARIEVLLPDQQPVVAVPATAVLSAPYGDSVYIIQEDKKAGAANQLTVRQQFVRTGRAKGDFVSIQSGLKPGERIVHSGIFKLRNGMPVVINNTLVPEASTSPKPSDT